MTYNAGGVKISDAWQDSSGIPAAIPSMPMVRAMSVHQFRRQPRHGKHRHRRFQNRDHLRHRWQHIVNTDDGHGDTSHAEFDTNGIKTSARGHTRTGLTRMHSLTRTAPTGARLTSRWHYSEFYDGATATPAQIITMPTPTGWEMCGMRRTVRMAAIRESWTARTLRSPTQSTAPAIRGPHGSTTQSPTSRTWQRRHRDHAI